MFISSFILHSFILQNEGFNEGPKDEINMKIEIPGLVYIGTAVEKIVRTIWVKFNNLLFQIS